MTRFGSDTGVLLWAGGMHRVYATGRRKSRGKMSYVFGVRLSNQGQHRRHGRGGAALGSPHPSAAPAAALQRTRGNGWDCEPLHHHHPVVRGTGTGCAHNLRTVSARALAHRSHSDRTCKRTLIARRLPSDCRAGPAHSEDGGATPLGVVFLLFSAFGTSGICKACVRQMQDTRHRHGAGELVGHLLGAGGRLR